MKFAYWLIILPILAILAFSFPREKDRFYKGNLHTHSYWSDGDTYPEEVAWWFKNNDYNFLVVTDHNTLQEGDKWINTDRNQVFQDNYQNYLQHYGGVGLVSEKRNSDLYVKLKTLEEYRSDFEVAGEFILVSGEEVTDGSEGKPVHLNAVHTYKLIAPSKGENVSSCLTANVKKMRQELKAFGNPEWIIVNHPNFGWALTSEQLAGCGARFFEVFNGHPSVRNYGDSEHPSTEELWDQANRIRILNGQDLLFGVANDDSHHYLEFAPNKANPGRSFTMVRAESLDPAALYKAMNAGDFYASTGLELSDFKVSEKAIKIHIAAEKDVAYQTEFIALIKGSNTTTIVSTQEGTKPKYKFTGEELFVRARISSSKQKENPYKKGDFEVAWLQPVIPE